MPDYSIVFAGEYGDGDKRKVVPCVGILGGKVAPGLQIEKKDYQTLLCCGRKMLKMMLISGI